MTPSPWQRFDDGLGGRRVGLASCRDGRAPSPAWPPGRGRRRWPERALASASSAAVTTRFDASRRSGPGRAAPHRADRGERRGAGDRVAPVGAAEAARVHGVHDLGAARDAGERHPAGDALGGGDQIGHDALVLAGEPRPRSGRSRSAPRRRRRAMPCSAHQAARAARKPGAGTTKPPSPWIGSISTQATLRRADLGLDLGSMARAAACAPGHPVRVAEGVGHRHPVDLGGEGPEAVLVRHVLGRERHRQVRPAVVGVVEDDGGLARPVARRAIFTAFSTASAPELNSADASRGCRASGGQLLADRDVALVGGDHEAGVVEAGHLLRNGLDHGRKRRARSR